MKYLAIFCAVICLIAAGRRLLAYWYRKQRRPETFWDVIRDPTSIADPRELHRIVNQQAQALATDSKRLNGFVDHYVFEVESILQGLGEYRILCELGSRAHPRACEILRSKRIQGFASTLRRKEDSKLANPIIRLCEILREDTCPPKEVVSLLEPFLHAISRKVRGSAALVIGTVPSPESLPALRLALSDEAPSVRGSTLKGLSRAIKGGPIDESEKKEIYEMVASMWPTDSSYDVCAELPTVLLELDRERAIPFLSSVSLFSPKFERVRRILSAFKQARVKPPRSQLIKLISEVESDVDKELAAGILEEALPLLGEHQDVHDLNMLESFLDHDHGDVVKGAALGMYRFHQIHERIRDSWDVVRENGWEALTIAERHICAIERLDAEVRNGGFAQYYFNSTGDHWQDAYQGLKKIGADKHLEVMRETLTEFVDSSPSHNREIRNAQIYEVAMKNEANVFHGTSQKWYDIEDNLDRLLCRYNLANLAGREKP